ncbi:mechanosensitive ion channel family protein [Amedibacillus sp. YH-ame10]
MLALLKTINDIGKGTFFNYGLLGTIIIMLIFLCSTYILIRILSRIIKTKQLANEKFILRLVKIVLYTIAIYACLSLLKPFESVLSKIWGSAGILAVVFGLAAQEALGNMVNGLLISTFKPFRIGDLVKVNNGEYEGYVADISLRDTVIKTYENTRIIIPNSVMNKAVLENVSRSGNAKGNFLMLEIGYESDLDKAMCIIQEEVMRHPNYQDARTPEDIANCIPPVIVRVIDFNESGLQLRTTIYSKNNAEGFAMLSDLRISIKKRFDQEGISFPYPHRTVVMK